MRCTTRRVVFNSLTRGTGLGVIDANVEFQPETEAAIVNGSSVTADDQVMVASDQNCSSIVVGVLASLVTNVRRFRSATPAKCYRSYACKFRNNSDVGAPRMDDLEVNNEIRRLSNAYDIELSITQKHLRAYHLPFFSATHRRYLMTDCRQRPKRHSRHAAASGHGDGLKRLIDRIESPDNASSCVGRHTYAFVDDDSRSLRLVTLPSRCEISNDANTRRGGNGARQPGDDFFLLTAPSGRRPDRVPGRNGQPPVLLTESSRNWSSRTARLQANDRLSLCWGVTSPNWSPSDRQLLLSPLACC